MNPSELMATDKYQQAVYIDMRVSHQTVVPEGICCLKVPEALSVESVEYLEAWTHLLLKQIRKNAQATRQILIQNGTGSADTGSTPPPRAA